MNGGVVATPTRSVPFDLIFEIVGLDGAAEPLELDVEVEPALVDPEVDSEVEPEEPDEPPQPARAAIAKAVSNAAGNLNREFRIWLDLTDS